MIIIYNIHILLYLNGANCVKCGMQSRPFRSRLLASQLPQTVELLKAVQAMTSIVRMNMIVATIDPINQICKTNQF